MSNQWAKKKEKSAITVFLNEMLESLSMTINSWHDELKHLTTPSMI